MPRSRCQAWSGFTRTLIGGATITAILGASSVSASVRFNDLGLGRLEVSGNIQTQNLIRHKDASSFSFIQQRNVLRTRIDWNLLDQGKLFNRFRIPGIERSKVFLLYRCQIAAAQELG